MIRFDYLVLVRYDQGKQTGWLEAIAGNDDLGVPLRTDLPLEGTPIDVLLATGETLYIPDLRAETRFRPDLMERYERYGILSGYWVLLTRGGETFGLPVVFLAIAGRLWPGRSRADGSHRAAGNHRGRKRARV